jgi:hypothetical protein
MGEREKERGPVSVRRLLPYAAFKYKETAHAMPCILIHMHAS